MTNSYLLDLLRPSALVQIIAELIEDHADEDSTGEFTFHTEAAQAAYAEALNAGFALMGKDEFSALLEATLS